MKLTFSLFFNIFFILCINSQVVFAENIDVEAGEQIFSQNCTACHSGGENSVNPIKTLKIGDLKDYSMYSSDKIVYQVTNGNPNGMPAFGGRLSEDDINNVAGYVLDHADKW
uniref:Cytochrome c-553 n=1 Tax=Cliftonaea pectinata TaxID=2007206 RepID=A0A1Z1MQH9_9FLOR|nr:cytochrome c553 [Cliftonaea pectinata]ARW68119.1 cytochrome c553 [Cliftonaea pectinata]